MITVEPIIQNLQNSAGYRLAMLRLDLLDAEISGNKWFKLKHNLEAAKVQGYASIITVGGAFSNHIAATAAACERLGFRCIGVIRGEPGGVLNPTLEKAIQQGMQLHFVSRELYARRAEPSFRDYLQQMFGPHYFVPEGGNNEEGISGCMEISRQAEGYDYIFCACGTGTTFAGLVAGKMAEQKVIGISVLKGENLLPREAAAWLSRFAGDHVLIGGNECLGSDYLDTSCIINTYAFNGYAKFSEPLFRFKQEFEALHTIPLDHVYTAKMTYATFDLVHRRRLRPGAAVLMIHSGGLQGNAGFEQRYGL